MSDTLIALRGMARDIEGFRIENDWTPAQLRAEIIGLPNGKTHARLTDIDDACEDIDSTRLLNQYTAAAERVADRRKKERLAEPEYNTFSNVLDTLEAVQAAWNETDIHRVVVVVGENGTGKDTSVRAVRRIYPLNCLYTKATTFWRESLAAMAEDTLTAIHEFRNDGHPLVIDRYPLARVRAMKAFFASHGKMIWIINDAHLLGRRGVEVVIDMVDGTPVIPLMPGIPTLLRQLAESNIEEARQLMGNRLCRFVTLNSPTATEITEMWKLRGCRFVDRDTQDNSATQVASEASEFGNWTYVKLFTRDLAKASKLTAINTVKFGELYGAFKLRRSRYSKVTSLLKARS